MVGRLEDKSQRHLESVLHFLGIQQQLESRPHEAHHRGHPKPAQDHVIRQVSDDRHETLLQPDLFAGLAQGRRGGA